jgi:hypothetical protein
MTAHAFPSPLDPGQGVSLERQNAHPTLREEYIWTAGDVTALRPDRNKFPWNAVERRTEPHSFRAHFSLSSIPQHGTLYLARPRSAKVFVKRNTGWSVLDKHRRADQFSRFSHGCVGDSSCRGQRPRDRSCSRPRCHRGLQSTQHAAACLRRGGRREDTRGPIWKRIRRAASDLE